MLRPTIPTRAAPLLWLRCGSPEIEWGPSIPGWSARTRVSPGARGHPNEISALLINGCFPKVTGGVLYLGISLQEPDRLVSRNPRHHMVEFIRRCSCRWLCHSSRCHGGGTIVHLPPYHCILHSTGPEKEYCVVVSQRSIITQNLPSPLQRCDSHRLGNVPFSVFVFCVSSNAGSVSRTVYIRGSKNQPNQNFPLFRCRQSSFSPSARLCKPLSSTKPPAILSTRLRQKTTRFRRPQPCASWISVRRTFAFSLEEKRLNDSSFSTRSRRREHPSHK